MVLRLSLIAQYAHLGFPSEVRVAIPRRVPRDFMVRPAWMQIRFRPASSDRLGFDSSVAKCFREVVHKEGGRPLPTRAKWAGSTPKLRPGSGSALNPYNPGHAPRQDIYPGLGRVGDRGPRGADNRGRKTRVGNL